MPTGPILSPAGRKLKAKRAGLTRHRGPNHTETVEAARDYRAEVLAEHVRKVVNAAPPLTAEQRDKIAALLRAPAAPAQLSKGPWFLRRRETPGLASLGLLDNV